MTATSTPCLSQRIELQAETVIDAQRLSRRRDRRNLDREFLCLMDLLGPRMRHYIHVYRLTDIAEDAEQVCAIAVHRALQNHDPAIASFSTHVTWQLRGELQSLRHRVRLDQRRSARSAGIRTVELDGLAGDTALPFEVVDESALHRTESGASEAMTLGLLSDLLGQLGSPEHEHRIVTDHLFDIDCGAKAYGYTREQRRQIIRRTFRNCGKVLASTGHDALS